MAFKRSAVRSRLSPPKENSHPSGWLFFFCCGGFGSAVGVCRAGRYGAPKARSTSGVSIPLISTKNKEDVKCDVLFLFCRRRIADLLHFDPASSRQKKPVRTYPRIGSFQVVIRISGKTPRAAVSSGGSPGRRWASQAVRPAGPQQPERRAFPALPLPEQRSPPYGLQASLALPAMR